MLRPAFELSLPSRDGGGQPVAHRAARATRAVPGIQAQSGAAGGTGSTVGDWLAAAVTAWQAQLTRWPQQ